MSVFKAQPMSYLQCVIPEDMTKSFMFHIGKLQIMSFVDLQPEVPPYKKKYSKEITRTRYLLSLVQRIEEVGERYEKWKAVGVTSSFESRSELSRAELELTEKNIRSSHQMIADHDRALTGLLAECSKLKDYVYILENLHKLSEEFDSVSTEKSFSYSPKETESALTSLGFHYLSGVAPPVKLATVHKRLNTISRGNVYVTTDALPNGRMFFLAFVVGAHLLEKTRTLFALEGVEAHSVSAFRRGARKELFHVRHKVKELEEVASKTERELQRTLAAVAPEIRLWKQRLALEELLCSELNKSAPGPSNNLLVLEGWCPQKHKFLVNKLMFNLSAEGGTKEPWVVNELANRQQQPSYFPTNKVTAAYQSIVNAYSPPRPDEVNPAALSLVIFPFLAGLMFSDVFHGFLLFVAALALCLYERKLRHWEENEIMVYVYSGRYLLLFMGVGSLFAGLLFNEFSGMRLSLFPRSFGPDTSGVYPFGVDWAWEGEAGESTFVNGLKMKLAVIIGFLHVMLGLFVAAFNDINNEDWVSFWLQSVPQIVAFGASFGYIVFMFYWKMLHPSLARVSVLQTIIGMLTMQVDEKDVLLGSAAAQKFFNRLSLLATFLALVVMAVGKPLALLVRRDSRNEPFRKVDNHPLKTSENDIGSVLTVPIDKNDSESTESTFAEVFFEQIIHTIEFGISMISNICSYLRLWTISLTHGEISKVLQSKLIDDLVPQLGHLLVSSFVFSFFTLALMLVLSVFECFLHTLRLQWIEFQNKFFKGDGVLFEPFVLRKEKN